MAVSAEALIQLVNTISVLVKQLPPTVPEATREDKIQRVMTGPIPRGEPHHEMFNRRFDALFGEDCRDEDGRLLHVKRGRSGMMLVSTYLNRIIDTDDMKKQAAVVIIKLERLKNELEYLWSANTRQMAVSYSLTCIHCSNTTGGDTVRAEGSTRASNTAQTCHAGGSADAASGAIDTQEGAVSVATAGIDGGMVASEMARSKAGGEAAQTDAVNEREASRERDGELEVHTENTGPPRSEGS